MKKTFNKILVLVIATSITCAGAAVVRTYKNEVNILNIYNSLNDIKISLKELSKKIDNLKE